MTTQIDFSKYKRFFGFGCSFTNYKWPTWADIISQEFTPETAFNYGACGAGNHYIANSVVEADLFHNLGPGDLVMVMFTNFHREDRFFKDKGWVISGNIYSQNFFNDAWMQYFDDDHALMRDLMLIRLLKGFLENKKVDFHFMSMVPLGHVQDGHSEFMTDSQKEILSAHKDIVSCIQPSIWETCFNCDWHSVQPRSVTFTGGEHKHHIRGKGWYEDNHAHPNEHIEYIQKLWPETKFKQSTIEYARHWHRQVIKKTDTYTDNLIQRNPVQRVR